MLIVESRVAGRLAREVLTRGEAEVSEVSRAYKLPLNVVLHVVGLMVEEGLVRESGGIVYPVREPLDVAFWVVRRYSVDLEFMLEDVDWQVFEGFTVRAFREAGFNVKSRCRFAIDNRRFEIDVLAWRDDIMLAIDCKHWKGKSRGWHIRRAALENLKRAMRLSKVASVKLGFEGKIYPVIVTLKDTPIRFHEGVAVVPIFRLRDFIGSLPLYLEELRGFKTSG